MVHVKKYPRTYTIKMPPVQVANLIALRSYYQKVNTGSSKKEAAKYADTQVKKYLKKKGIKYA